MFVTWNDLWRYLVTMHNGVNVRTHKLQLTEAEALTVWQKEWAALTHGYSQDFWDVLTFCVFSGVHDPNQVTPEESEQLKRFLQLAVSVMPFGGQNNARTTMLDLLEAEVMPWSSRDAIMVVLTSLYNSVAPLVQQPTRSYTDYQQTFHARFQPKEHVSLVRATQMHEEDQRKLVDLQKQLYDGAVSPNTTATTCSCLLYQVVAGVMSSLVLLYVSYRVWHWRQAMPFSASVASPTLPATTQPPSTRSLGRTSPLTWKSR
jgi:hypothetical protein